MKKKELEAVKELIESVEILSNLLEFKTCNEAEQLKFDLATEKLKLAVELLEPSFKNLKNKKKK
jgi:hypothetical protein